MLGDAALHGARDLQSQREAMANYPLHPARPERVCWGCAEYCPADDLTCGKDTVRTPHPPELFGDDWQEARESAAHTPDELTGSRVVEALHDEPGRSVSVSAGRQQDLPVAEQK